MLSLSRALKVFGFLFAGVNVKKGQVTVQPGINGPFLCSPFLFIHNDICVSGRSDTARGFNYVLAVRKALPTFCEVEHCVCDNRSGYVDVPGVGGSDEVLDRLSHFGVDVIFVGWSIVRLLFDDEFRCLEDWTRE